MEQQTILQDTDIPPVTGPSPLAALHSTLSAADASAKVPAAAVLAALQTSASVPAAPGSAARDSATSALKHSTSTPVDKLAQEKSPNSAAAGIAASATVSPAGNAEEGEDSASKLKHVPHSPVLKSSQDLHRAAATSSPAAAASPAAAPESAGMSQQGRSKVWLPPAPVASPQRSSGDMPQAITTSLTLSSSL